MKFKISWTSIMTALLILCIVVGCCNNIMDALAQEPDHWEYLPVVAKDYMGPSLFTPSPTLPPPTVTPMPTDTPEPAVLVYLDDTYVCQECFHMRDEWAIVFGEVHNGSDATIAVRVAITLSQTGGVFPLMEEVYIPWLNPGESRCFGGRRYRVSPDWNEVEFGIIGYFETGGTRPLPNIVFSDVRVAQFGEYLYSTAEAVDVDVYPRWGVYVEGLLRNTDGAIVGCGSMDDLRPLFPGYPDGAGVTMHYHGDYASFEIKVASSAAIGFKH